MENFPYIDALLLVSGMKLARHKNRINYLNNFLGFFFLSQVSIRFALNVVKLFGNFDVFDSIFFLTFYFALIINYILFQRKKSKFSKLLVIIYSLLRQKQKIKLQNKSKQWFYIMIGLIIITLIISVIKVFGYDQRETFQDWFLVAFDETSMLKLISMVIYVALIDTYSILNPAITLMYFNLNYLCYHEFELLLITEMEDLIQLSLRQESSIKDIKHVRATRNFTEELRRKIDIKLGLLPFIWITVLFLDSCCRISSLILHFENWIFLNYAYIFFNIPVSSISLIIVIFTAEEVTNKLDKLTKKIIEFVEVTESDIQLKDHICLLKSDILISPFGAIYAWQALKLDRNLFLTFLGSSVTFIVMIITLFKNT